MKKIIAGFLVLLGLLVQTGCEDKIYETYLANSPVYLTYDELRAAVKSDSPRTIQNPGKIYFKDNYIFINELMKGVHVIDVSNPATPVSVAFISIPGNVDMAIKENTLFADSYVDLVAIDLSDVANMHEVGRVKDVLPYVIPSYDANYRIEAIDQQKGVVVGWEMKEVKHRLEQIDYPVYAYDELSSSASQNGGVSAGVGGTSGSTFGIGGSMARFGLNGNFLYVVDSYRVLTFNITDLSNPVDCGSKTAGWGIETLFVYDNHLFLGATSGMIVFSVEVPESPSYVNQYTHLTACDPVVVQNDLAYVTLHDGGWCGRSVNRLDVLQMSSNYAQLNAIASFPMAGPQGLGIDGDVLFVCDGNAGLKIFDASDPLTITSHPLAAFPSIQPTDVVPVGNYLFAIGVGGFYLYDYSNLNNIRLLSHIGVFLPD